MSNENTNFRFRLAAIMTVLSAVLAGFFNVGSLYVFGIPFVPLAVSLIVLWKTRTSFLRKGLATLVAILFIPVGFFVWVWWADITVHLNR